MPLLQEQQANGGDDRGAPDHVTPLDDGLLGEADGEVVDEVPDAVVEVEDERPGGDELDARLGGDGQGGEGGDQRLALEVPAQQRRRQVGGRVDVQRPAQPGAREPLPDGAAEVGLLLVVDLQVRADGPKQPLLVEDRVPLVGGELLGCDGAVRGGSLAICGSVGRVGGPRGGGGCSGAGRHTGIVWPRGLMPVRL